jgi:hypothetical protein
MDLEKMELLYHWGGGVVWKPTVWQLFEDFHLAFSLTLTTNEPLELSL